MKKILLFAMVLILLASVSAVYAEAELEVDAGIPDRVVQPGGSFTLLLKIKNDGDTGAYGIHYELFTDSAITGTSSGLHSIGGIASGSSRTKEIPLTVSSTASTGDHIITVQVRYSGGSGELIQQQVIVPIGDRVDLHLESLTLYPELFEPGNSVTIYANIKNVGKDDAKNIFATIEANNSDIKPVLAGGSDYAAEIPVGGTQLFEFTIGAESGTDTGMYSAEITVDYEGSAGNKGNTTFNVGIPVSGEPNLQLMNAEMDDGEFEAEFQNLGTAKAKAIRAELVQGGKTMSVDVENEIKPDKKTTFTFKKYTAGTGTIELEYLDDENKEYSDSVAISIATSSGEGGSPLGTVLLIIVVVIVAVYLYKRRKKKK